jgi:hypothetical protein
MASIVTPSDGRYRANVFVAGKRKSRVFRTKRKADAWAARTETVLREERKSLPGERFTLADALRKYRDEISEQARRAVGACAYRRVPRFADLSVFLTFGFRHAVYSILLAGRSLEIRQRRDGHPGVRFAGRRVRGGKAGVAVDCHEPGARHACQDPPDH